MKGKIVSAVAPVPSSTPPPWRTDGNGASVGGSEDEDEDEDSEANGVDKPNDGSARAIDSSEKPKEADRRST